MLSHAPLISKDQLLPPSVLSGEFFVFVLLFPLIKCVASCCLGFVDPSSLLELTVWFPSLRFHSPVELSSSQVGGPQREA